MNNIRAGGEEGARTGPSLMPGGPKEAFDAVEPFLSKCAAQVFLGTHSLLFVKDIILSKLILWKSLSLLRPLLILNLNICSYSQCAISCATINDTTRMYSNRIFLYLGG